MDGEELTAQQTALYDRQIRVWGVDAQKRLSKAQILVSGLNGTSVEFCKNIVLAGVGSLTLMDDRLVTEDALQANFLIPRDETVYSGRSLSELCCESLRDFNPMVRVLAEKGDLAQCEMEFLDKFDVVVVTGCSLKTKIEINEKCRKRAKRIAFYAIECRDSCGEIFVDLQNYTYAQDAILLPWRNLPRKVSKLYFAMRVIEKFELSEGRNPGELSNFDLPAVLKLRKELCDAQSLNESHVPETLLERILVAGPMLYPPVCPILGGILGQEVIKAISGKGDPLKNFFYFDAADGKGVIEDISNPSSI
ncbi:SUMO-activating enzyme subunit 1A isoform X2 [Musa acuminata AAA Group]|uniref:SUMO-activating enzyme subunit 1A-like isoform X2 n=1 Tax=Musa acuminata AAA Group TaxID=214697 RepID=UPI0031D09AD1